MACLVILLFILYSHEYSGCCFNSVNLRRNSQSSMNFPPFIEFISSCVKAQLYANRDTHALCHNSCSWLAVGRNRILIVFIIANSPHYLF